MATTTTTTAPSLALASLLTTHLHLPYWAKRVYSHLLKTHPTDPSVLTSLAFLHIKTMTTTTTTPSTTTITKCLELLDEALEQSGGIYVPALRGKGILAATLDHDHHMALYHYHQAMTIMPTSTPLLRTTAMHLLLTFSSSPLPPPEVWKEAISNLEKALLLEPHHIPTIMATALAKLYYNHDYKATTHLLKRAIRTCSSSSSGGGGSGGGSRRIKGQCYRLLGHLYYDHGHNDHACEAFTTALLLLPHDPTTLAGYAAAIVSSSRDKTEEAEKYFDRMFKMRKATVPTTTTTTSTTTTAASTTTSTTPPAAAAAGVTTTTSTTTTTLGRPLPPYCLMMYGVFRLKVRYDKKGAREMFAMAATDKSRCANCLALLSIIYLLSLSIIIIMMITTMAIVMVIVKL